MFDVLSKHLASDTVKRPRPLINRFRRRAIRRARQHRITPMTSLHTLVKLPVQIAESAGSIVGLRFGTEEPHHRVTDRIGDVEIRVYGPRVAAETVVAADDDAARSIGFRRLARYIFGGNHSGVLDRDDRAGGPVGSRG